LEKRKLISFNLDDLPQGCREQFKKENWKEMAGESDSCDNTRAFTHKYEGRTLAVIGVWPGLWLR